MKTIVLNWIVKHLNELVIACGALLLPSRGLMIAIGFLIAIDFITGIYAAYKSKEKVTSRKMRRTGSKFVFYNVAIITGVILTYIVGDFIPIVKGIATFLAVVETYSILENINKITGVNILPYLKNLINKHKDSLPDGNSGNTTNP